MADPEPFGGHYITQDHISYVMIQGQVYFQNLESLKGYKYICHFIPYYPVSVDTLFYHFLHYWNMYQQFQYSNE